MAEQRARPPLVSIVVPTHNSSNYLAQTLRQALGTLQDWDRTWELILVDDASTDDTWALIGRLLDGAGCGTGIRLRSNVGQIGALLAGFSIATGATVIAMDDDLTLEQTTLDALVAAIESGYDFASGARTGRRPALRAMGSAIYNARLRRSGFPFEDAGCGMNALSAQLCQRLVSLGWQVRGHRCKPAIHLIGAAVTNVEVGDSTSISRPSNYPISELAASWIDVERFLRGRGDAPIPSALPTAAAAMTAAAAFVGSGGLSTHTRRSVAALTFGAALATYVVATSTTDLVNRSIARASERPPFQIADRCTGSPEALTTAAPGDAEGTRRGLGALQHQDPGVAGQPAQSRP